MRPQRTRIVRAIVVSLLLAGCAEGPGDGAPPVSEGTTRMVARLREIVDSADPLADEQLNRARIRYFIESEPPTSREAAVLQQGLIAKETLHAGLTQMAIDRFFAIRAVLSEVQTEPVPGFVATLDELLGIALLRRGLELACPPEPSSIGAASGAVVDFPCWPDIPPPRSTALPDAAYAALERAIQWQEAEIEDKPEDLRARWFLNIAAMAAGTWPERVPAVDRFSVEAIVGAGELLRFDNVASGAGLDAVSVSGGGIVDDFNGDGLLDVMVSSRGLLDQIRYFESDGSGRFAERTVQAGLEGLVGGLNILQADYDNDGDPDVLVLRGGWLVQGYPNSLLRNDGGVFSDVTYEANIDSEHPTQTGAWGDYDGDGWLDLFIGNESRDGVTHVSELFRNRGDGTFEDVASTVGLAVGAFVKGVTWGDYDDDGLPDLYLSILHAPNQLFRNLGPSDSGSWSFEEVTERAGVGEPLASFPTWFWDFDNDGRLDLFVAGYSAQTADIAREILGRPHTAEMPRLYRNQGDGTFADVTAEQGLDRIMYAMGSNYGDLDNDGWLDFYVGTGDPDYRQLMPNRMFRNTGEGFEEVTGAGGFGGLDKGHGVSFVDIDNDGDTDVHIVLGGANEGDLSPNALFENPGFGNHWLVLALDGEAANRAGVGARVAVKLDGPEGQRTLHRVVGTGGSFGANPLRLEIGLGGATRIREVEIRWPGSGTVDVLPDLELDRAYRVREGSGSGESVDRPTIRLGGV